MSKRPFWEEKTLEEMTPDEWESMCDHCGLCCIVRIEDENNGDVYDTNVICAHYDCESRQCADYGTRTTFEDGCVQLTPALLETFDWLPDSCAYVRHAKGLPLLAGHPLLGQAELDGDTQIINVVDKYAPMGLIKNNEEVIHEQHLVFPDEFENQA